MITLRSNRLFILGFVSLLVGALYIFYPSDHFSSPHTPSDQYADYEAGGIDSDHWREPIVPDFEKEVARDEICEDGECAVGSGSHKGSGAAGAKDRVKAKLGAGKEGNRKEQAAIGVPAKVYGGKVVKAAAKVAEKKPVVQDEVLEGGVIMPKMENATAKAELGRAAWRVLHLQTLRYPEAPTPDDRTALKTYFHLFARLYPCGECAAEFQKLLKQYPPQTSSRKTASMWLCSVHNMINERLGKEEFDCLTLNDVYDCGCGPDGEGETSAAEEVKKVAGKVADKAAAAKEKVVAVKDQTKEKVKAVKEKAGAVIGGANDKLAPAPKAKPNAEPKPNRPLGGMNAKEKAGEGVKAGGGDKTKPPAGSGQDADEPRSESDDRPLRQEEIVYNPPQRVKDGVKGKVADHDRAEKQQAAAIPVEEDQGEEDDAVEAEETEEVEEDELIPNELTGEDAEEDEDDSELIDGDDLGEAVSEDLE